MFLENENAIELGFLSSIDWARSACSRTIFSNNCRIPHPLSSFKIQFSVCRLIIVARSVVPNAAPPDYEKMRYSRLLEVALTQKILLSRFFLSILFSSS